MDRSYLVKWNANYYFRTASSKQEAARLVCQYQIGEVDLEKITVLVYEFPEDFSWLELSFNKSWQLRDEDRVEELKR